MTAGEWMTAGEGNETQVPEMTLQLEKIDVSYTQADIRAAVEIVFSGFPLQLLDSHPTCSGQMPITDFSELVN